MSVVYLDTSCLVAIAFAEPGWQRTERALRRFDRWMAGNLLEAELRAAFAREQVDGVTEILEGISWVFPDRPLSTEYGRVLDAGFLRGADLRHVACALWLAPDAAELAFASLAARQREVAAALGFSLVPRSP